MNFVCNGRHYIFMVKKRVYAYFDGGNFYHLCKSNYGIVKVQYNQMSNQMIQSDSEELKRIKYFTAPVNQQECPEMYTGQQKFFNKLRVTPLLDIVLGKLVSRKLNRINIKCPTCDIQKAEELQCPKCSNKVLLSNTYKTSEKGVDVDLAINLLIDALNDKYDVALLFSSDADFCPAIKYILKELGKEVIYCGFPFPRTSELIQCCSNTRIITKDAVESSRI